MPSYMDQEDLRAMWATAAHKQALQLPCIADALPVYGCLPQAEYSQHRDGPLAPTPAG